MTPEVAVIERLRNDAAVAAIVSTRVYQLKLPQAPTLPAIRVQRISDVRGSHLRGVDGLHVSRIQVDAVAHEYDATNPDALGTANDLADAIDAALAGQAFLTADSPASLQIYFIERLDKMDFYSAEELRQVRVVQDYGVYWMATAA